MKAPRTTALLLAALVGIAASSPAPSPWRAAGWSDPEAAAHLLDRFAFGPRPGEVERVVAMGLERWIEAQLAAELPEGELERRLAGLAALELPVERVGSVYPPPGRFLMEARAAGVVPEDLDPARLREPRDAADRRLRLELGAFARERGYRRQRELLETLSAQKLIRAVHAENQLVEVLTDFWFNHFNVSVDDPQARPYVLAYERDVIRPLALGRFRELLGATARHPAMLFYLDNAASTAGADDPTTLDAFRRRSARTRGRFAGARRRGSEAPLGLNENYARELLELHTLGVDGGYTQGDVVEVARAFTGWTARPRPEVLERHGPRLQVAMAAGAGFVLDGGFFFRADAHDAGPKRVLGRDLAPGRGVEDGEEVLDLVAAHPSTARHLAAKLATRFVGDQPPESLVDRLARELGRGGGDLRRVIRVLVYSPELWAAEARAAKIKSPLELAVSAVRAVGGRLDRPAGLGGWIERMGQPLYACPAPTGFPDRAEHWLNAGAVLNRSQFLLALAAGEVPGVRHPLGEPAATAALGAPAFQQR